MTFLREITLSDLLAAVGALAAFIGIPLTWVLARRSRRSPQLQYAVDFDVLADPADGLVNAGLSMKFRGSDVERVSRTYVAFWNRSGDTVDRDDVLPNDPLRVLLRSGDVPLQTRVAFRSRQQNDLRSRIEKDEVLIDFNFLDAGDGGIIEILHQGATSPVVVGTVKGAKLQRVGGRVDLTAGRLEWMSQKGIHKRILHRIQSSMAYHSRRRRFGLLVPVATSILMVVAVVFIGSQMLRSPHLVNAANYNLTTLQGQREFSSKVQEVGKTPDDEPILLAFLLVQGAGMSVLLASIFWGRRYIPRSIVAERVPPTAVTSESTEAPETLPVAAGVAHSETTTSPPPT